MQYAFEQIKRGEKPDNHIVVPGVLPYADYAKRRAMWSKVRQSIGLDAEFPDDTGTMLYPAEWLNRAEEVARNLRRDRRAKAIGVDPGEGGADTCWTAVDEFGVIEQISVRTPDTSVIPGATVAFLRKHGVPPEKVAFDRGGGGKQHADTLRSMGFMVQTVAFGESVQMDVRHARYTVKDRQEWREDRYVYVNRRAEMFGSLHLLLSPQNVRGFGIPRECEELRRQLSLFPLLYDKEGRMRLPPKNRTKLNSSEETLIDIIGCSPDEADSLALSVYALTHKTLRKKARVS